ncbi:MAG: protein sorting system archaetidylserine synthase [Halobacteriaceae archaeon]
MQPRFVGRLSLADAVTTTNAAVGFVAVAVAGVDVDLAARLVLLAAIADGLDGVIADQLGSSEVGAYLDGLADVASFGVAPGMLVATVAWTTPLEWSVGQVLAVGVPAVYVAVVVVRLGLYTELDAEDHVTEGVQSTLAGTVLAAAVLSGAGATVLLGVTALFWYLMVAPIGYPDLLVRDAFLMGAVQALAVLAPGMAGGLFPKALLAWAVAYLVLAPSFYWR